MNLFSLIVYKLTYGGNTLWFISSLLPGVFLFASHQSCRLCAFLICMLKFDAFLKTSQRPLSQLRVTQGQLTQFGPTFASEQKSDGASAGATFSCFFCFSRKWRHFMVLALRWLILRKIVWEMWLTLFCESGLRVMYEGPDLHLIHNYR